MTKVRYHVALKDHVSEWGELEELGDDRFRVTVGEITHEVEAHWVDDKLVSLLRDDTSVEAIVEPQNSHYFVTVGGNRVEVRVLDERAAGQAGTAGEENGPARVTVTMPGKVILIPVRVGDEVTKGQGIIIVEAMKMENEITAPRDGTVKEILVEEGQSVEAGTTLIVIE